MRRRRTIAIAAASLTAATAAWIVWRPAADGAEAQEPKPTSTATAERRDLVERETLDGTLGFADQRSLVNRLSGTLTGIRPEGSTVRRGGVLYRVDERPVLLMYGRTPAWRTFASGMTDGEDVRQLERNLVALGYDPGDDIEIDDEFDWATEAAIERMQRDLGVEDDGTLELGEIVFSRGPVRVGAHDAEVGASVGPGTAVMTISSTDRVVIVDLEADRQDLVRRGDRVRVELPSGETVTGVVSHVGRVAEGGGSDEEGEDAEPTVEVTIQLVEEPRGRALDQAPVDVEIETSRADDVLAVPITALLALAEGGYAVEVVDENGDTRLVAVDVGAYADGWVEISGDGIREGTEVVVPE